MTTQSERSFTLQLDIGDYVMKKLVHPLEVDYFPKSAKEIAEKLNINESEVVDWRKQAPSIPECDEEEKAKNRAGGPITKPEDWIGSEAKEHYCRVKEAAEELKIPEWKVLYLLHKGLLDGVNVCKLCDPDKNLTCYYIYNASIVVYQKHEE